MERSGLTAQPEEFMIKIFSAYILTVFVGFLGTAEYFMWKAFVLNAYLYCSFMLFVVFIFLIIGLMKAINDPTQY